MGVSFYIYKKRALKAIRLYTFHLFIYTKYQNDIDGRSCIKKATSNTTCSFHLRKLLSYYDLLLFPK